MADVRRYPGSRKHPQFNPSALAASLGEHKIEYLPFPDLGGRRTPVAGSMNTVWRNAAFRAYADFMETEEFHEAFGRLMATAATGATAIMCAEGLWWRCHRALIADALKAAGIRVLHITAAGGIVEHPYTSAARLVDGRLAYGPAGH